MFLYSDPGKTLKPAKALSNYRLLLHTQYVGSARTPGSAFTLLEAFREVSSAKVQKVAVEWAAFPRSSQASNDVIDQDRFRLQDEYVEWRVERSGAAVSTITFTTDFLAYYEALARVGAAELAAAITVVIPGANPKPAELFGQNFDPATASEEVRARRFIAFAQRNPWVNGQKGLLCLGHGSNSLVALFGLVDAAAIPNPSVPVAAICSALGRNCVQTRNSDPSIAAAVQSAARGGSSLTLADPVGIEIARLSGIWRIGDNEIDVNDPSSNSGVWKVTRGGRRGELRVVSGLRLDDSPVTSGAQVAAALRVKASVLVAADADLPEWARLGQEGSQRLLEIATEGI